MEKIYLVKLYTVCGVEYEETDFEKTVLVTTDRELARNKVIELYNEYNWDYERCYGSCVDIEVWLNNIQIMNVSQADVEDKICQVLD